MIESKSRPSVVAVPAQDLALVVELLDRAREVRVRRVLRGDLERHLLAAAGDPQRDAALLQRQRPDDRAVDLVVGAVERRRAGRPRLVHDLDALAQAPQAILDRREAVPVGAPLVLVPAAADAHLGASARDQVDGRGDLREVRRVAVAHRGAHLPEADAAGRRREGRHERPRLVRGLFGGQRDGVEVVVDPQRFPGSGIRLLSERVHRRPLLRGVDADQIESPALGDEGSESHRSSLWSPRRRPARPRRSRGCRASRCGCRRRRFARNFGIIQSRIAMPSRDFVTRFCESIRRAYLTTASARGCRSR